MENQKYKKIGLGILVVVLFLASVFGAYKIYQSKNSILAKKFNSRFDLSVEKQSIDGIKSNSVFVFRSKINLSEKEVQEILKFDPVIDYEVKKVYEKSAGVQTALADSGQDGKETVSAYEIAPKEELQKGSVYKAIISDPKYADHEYGWSFQIKAPFQVVKTHPRNKGTSVPINSGIEIAFNREKMGEGKDFFEISPKVLGKFETRGSTLIFVPEKLKEKTIYEVTIKKGLKNKEEGEILEKDFKFTFETVSSEKESNEGRFDFDSDFLEFIPGKKPVFSVYTSDIKKENLKLDVYRIATADEFSESYLENYREDYTWTRYNRNDLSEKNDLSKFEKILSINPEIIKTQEYGGSFIELPQNLENGFYIFDATFNNKHNQVWVQVNPLSSYYAISDEKGLAWSYDFLKKQPTKGTEFFFLTKGKKEISLGKTDEKGILNFSTPEGLKEKKDTEYKSDPALLKIEKDGAIGFLSLGNEKTQKGNLYWSHLSSDRSIYKMTDTVKFWGVVKGRKTDMREKKVTVEMYRGFGMGDYLPYASSEEPLDSKELMISRADSISGEFSFKGYTPGYYYLKVKFGEEEIANTMIEILTYSKPAYQIEVTPSKEKIFAGEDVSFHIKSSFFDGTAVSGSELKYSSWGGEDFNGEIKLDENGEADLVYSSKYDDQKRRQISSSFTLNVSPKYSEEGEISGSANVQIFGPNIYLQSFYEGGDNQESQFKAKLNKVDLSGKEYVGEPVAEHTVKAEIYKITYEKKENGEYYDPIEKVSRKTYDFEKKEEKLEDFEGKTDKNGEWKFGKKLNWENEVYYKVIFSVKDDNGRITEDELYPYNRSYFSPSNIFETSLSINGEDYSDELKFGEKAKLEMKISGDKKEDHSAILFFRYQNNIDKFWISSEGNLEDEFLESMAPSVQYKAVVLGPFGFKEANSVQALLDRSEKKLNVKIDPEKEKYAPKEKAKVNLEITDKNNSPVEAQINVSAVDEALFHILPYDWQKEIVSDLYVPIYTDIISGGSKYTQVSANGAERGGCFLGGTKITMNDGKKKSIEDIEIGDKILTFSNENKKQLESAIVQGVSNHKVKNYLIINDVLKVTPEHRIFVNDAWQEAREIKLGDVLWNEQSEKIIVKKIEPIFGGEVDVYNIIVGKFHTYLAEDFYVHNEEKGGSARVNFVDAATFQNIHSDKNGKASFEFVMPDNLTAWRTTVKAYDSKNIQAGENYKLIKSGLPFFVDATLGEYYLEGDKPVLRVRFFGDEYKKDLPVEISIKSSSLGIDKKEIVSGNNYVLSLDALPQGKHEFTISAKQEKLEDVLVRKTKVVKSYFRKLKSEHYNLSDKTDGIKGATEGTTTLVFSDSGKGKYYNNLWEAVYSDGLRIEKNLSSYWAKKMLKEFFKEEYSSQDLALNSYYTEEGAFSLFPNFGDSDLEVSAKVADLSVEEISKDKLANYFYKSLQDEKTDLSRVSKALYGLASLGEPVISKLEVLKENKDLDLESKLYLALAFSKIGEKEKAREYYYSEIRKMIVFKDSLAWIEQKDEEKKIKLTSLGALLVSHLDEKNDLEKMFNFINGNELKNDLNLIEKTAIAKDNLPRFSKENSEFSYKIGQENKKINLENGRVFSLDVTSENLKNITFSNILGNISMENYWEQEADAKDVVKTNEISLERSYLSGEEEKNIFSEGEVVKVRITPHIGSSALDGNYQIIDYLPSGLRPIMRTYARGFGDSFECDPIWYPERIEDNKVYFRIWKNFEKANNCSNRTINYYARVINKGSYKADPAIIQSMEDSSVLNISSQKNIEIK